jgi:CheY-like chemotaxis protein
VSTPHSVLIVDDEFGLAEMLRELLSESGYAVALAINGRLALDIVRERGVDLVITDLMMPVMDGLELAATLRASESYRSIPIIMMTSLPTAVPHNRGLFDVVLRKPFTPEDLLRAMATCLTAPQVDGSDGSATPQSR